MNPYQLLLPAFAVTLLASCQLPTSNPYDTDPYGLPDASYDGKFGDSVYEAPPAYEDGADAPDLTPVEPAQIRRHKVVRGDTLSGISRKYNVSISAIKRANNMRNDIVVLGRTLIIPTR